MLAAPAGKTLFKHAAPEHRMPMPQAGKTPGIVFSGPDGEQHLLAFERQGLAKLVAKLGRTGWAVSLFDLQIRSEDGSSTAVRALVSHQSRVLRFPLHRPLHFLTLLPRRPAQAAPCPAAASFAAAVPPLQGRQVHMTADTDAIENVTLIECPADRPVRVEVPLKVIGDDVSPGLKAGGRINWIRRTIPCLARGDSIPRDFTVDIRCGGTAVRRY
jgi:large subunit ribosomal protein L25